MRRREAATIQKPEELEISPSHFGANGLYPERTQIDQQLRHQGLADTRPGGRGIDADGGGGLGLTELARIADALIFLPRKISASPFFLFCLGEGLQRVGFCRSLPFGLIRCTVQIMLQCDRRESAYSGRSRRLPEGQLRRESRRSLVTGS